MQPSRLRLVARQLALYLLPPYRSMVAHFAQLTEKIDRIEQSQIASSAAQDRTLAVLQQLSDTLAFAKQQGSSESSQNDSEFQKPTAVNKNARSRIQIVITRVDAEWVITPDLFEVFSFQDGDQLSVIPAEEARQLPNTLGDTHIQIRPGAAIRVPSIYRFFEYKGFDIPVHLITLTGAGPETFEAIAQAHIERFQKHVGIEPDMRIIDFGSGIGRDAFQLFDFVSPAGEYIGIDVTRDSIVWCQNYISKKYRNFRFYHFDAENELYNPYGIKTSMDFRLPVEDGSVDRIFLSSVFTHLFEAEVLHYMKEFRRVLKPTGLAYASFFHLTPEALEAANTKRNTAWEARFDIPLGNGVFANDPHFPRGAIGFTDEAANRLINQSGLRLDRPFLKGWWSGLYGDAAEDGQDVMILGR